MRSNIKLELAISEAVGPRHPMSIHKGEEIANSIERSVRGILTELGVYAIDEDIWQAINDLVIMEDETSRNIVVNLIRTGPEHNLYEISIPVKNKVTMLKTYQSHPNEKKAGETDEGATERIVKAIKEYVKNLIIKANKAKKEGRDADAMKMIEEFMIPKNKAIEVFEKELSGSKSHDIAGISPHIRSIAKGRESFLHRRGLLSRQDIAKSIKVTNERSLLRFIDKEVSLLSRQYRGWAELGQTGPITSEELNEFLPTAKYNTELAEFVWRDKVGDNLSLDAIEAIVAASLAISAGVRVANRRVEAAHAVR